MGGASRGASLCTILLGLGALLSCSALPARHSGIQGLRGGGWKAPQFGVSRKHGLGKVSAPPAEAAAAAGQKVTRRGSLAGVTVVAMIYFLSVALAIPALPKLVNTVVGDSQGRASARGQMALATLMATDAFFTLCTNNLWGTMSDKYGRKPFMCMSAVGIALGAALISSSSSVALWFLGAAIDGCTSCMFGIGQAYVSDISDPEELAGNIGLFMGIAAGVSFMFGIPISAILTAKVSPRAPFAASAVVGMVNALAILFLLPESNPVEARREVRLSDANPWGALKMLHGNPLVQGVALSYALLWFAHTGLQVTWMNFFDSAHGWAASKAGAVLSVFGLGVAILPKLILRVLPLQKAVGTCLLVYAFAMAGLGLVKGSDVAVYMVLVFACVGSTSLPSTLSYIANQADPKEKGAMQGATETVKTMCTIVAGPAMSSIFAYHIAAKRAIKRPGAIFIASSALLIASWVNFSRTIRLHGHLDRCTPKPPKERKPIG